MAQFTDHLASLGHTTLTVGGYGDAARHFAVWLQQLGIAIAQVDEDTCAGFAAHWCSCPGIRRHDRVLAMYARRASRFVWFLAGRGVVGRLALPTPAPIEPRVALFQNWLRQHRGISESTISRYGRMVARLQIALGTDPARYTAASIRQAVLDELRGTSAAHVKTMTTALRGADQWRRHRPFPALYTSGAVATQAIVASLQRSVLINALAGTCSNCLTPHTYSFGAIPPKFGMPC